MLYPKNFSEKLSKDLFENPTSEYRGTPFWAWNCKLEQGMINEQVDIMQEMGFGGFHMHVRTGLDTPYLSEEYMQRIRGCVEYADSKDMLSWLYDEDRWPSGAAGGLVTCDERYRERRLMLTVTPRDTASDSDIYLLACFDVELNADGTIKNYRTIGEMASAAGTKWYAYVVREKAGQAWYNGYTYVNTLDKPSIEKFVEVTHEKYKETVGEFFGKSIPAIFCDEPQFSRKRTLPFATSTQDVFLPWTDNLPDTFFKAYSEKLTEHLPELFWELPDGKVSVIRYHYHDHVLERFADAFADTCGNWCEKNGIALTGHMMEEPTLFSQTKSVGEAMRSYRSFALPGIDMLCARFEFTTAKQAQSAVHQYGREGMLSELYGVTGWDYDFRGYKLHGDWQAALGVTIRVPHLSWMSMAGEAKRDYPASIFYQSPWYKEFSYIENHFARVNTAMTRGKPIVRVAVVHPIESYWLHWGSTKETSLARSGMDERFLGITEWLLKGGIDFDFICESLLPTQCDKGGAPLQVGKMAYDVIIVPACETLRSTTLERLRDFAAQGGRLIFAGELPKYVDAKPDKSARDFAAGCECINYTRSALLSALDNERTVSLINASNGNMMGNLIYQLREDNGGEWLFISHAEEPEGKNNIISDNVAVEIAGEWVPTLYDTLSGQIVPLDYKITNGKTVITRRMYSYDSLLIRLDKQADADGKYADNSVPEGTPVVLPRRVEVTLSEPNALLLDMAEYSLDGGEFSPTEEILRLDTICRNKLGWPVRSRDVVQPWTIKHETPTHAVTLRFIINSKISVSNAKLAIEDAERVEINLNGAAVASVIDGWYVDKSIKTVALPTINTGKNILTVKIPFGKRTNLEWCYIIGDFGVNVSGTEALITEPVRTLTFSDIGAQGLPFYGGAVTYHVPFKSLRDTVTLTNIKYVGGTVIVDIDGQKGCTALPPYAFTAKVGAGEHTADITLYGNRQNSFGAVHCMYDVTWVGPNAWHTTGNEWSYEYQLRPVGLLSSPTVSE